MGKCSLIRRPNAIPLQDRSRRTLEVILDTAAELIVELGYDQTSTNAIAARAGISIGSLYRYFPDKQCLLAALVARESTELRSIFTDMLSDDESPVDIEVILDRLVAPLAERTEKPRLCMRILHGASASRDFERVTRDLDAEMRMLVERLLGRIVPGLPAELLSTRARVCMGVFETIAAEIELAASEAEVAALCSELRGLLGSWIRSMGDDRATNNTSISCTLSPWRN